MDEKLSVYTFGGLTIHKDGKPVDALHSRKAQALLVYLVVTSRPQPREVLANLLWEDFSQQRAMNNLRVVLSSLRKHLGDYLLITRDIASINPEIAYDLDVSVLDSNLDFAGDYERKSGTLNQETITRIEQAVDLYQGEFLSGFFVEQAPEFESWMVVERERLHHIVLDGLGKLVRWELGGGAYTAGIQHASKWLQLDPLSETAHRGMMQLLAFSGQRGEALKQYQRCQQILLDELGVEPDARTTALFEQIKAGVLAPDESIIQPTPIAETDRSDIRRHNLPAQTTPFIGRERELVELNKLLSDPDVRVVTVLGAGGMGKTRLALEVAEVALEQFADGVYFVSLAGLQSEELIVPSIIQALGIEFVGTDTGGGDSQPALKDHLLRNLRRKQMLLILDNFEHLIDGANLVGEIVRTAPKVKVLATSRSRLNVGGEHRFQVTGMPYPVDPADEELQKYSAVRLFIESARRARSDFKLQQDDLVHIAQICRIVEGMPLGIRLAAAWVEMLSPEEIAAEIAQSLDLLETDLIDVPERQRSIRALYNHSWSLLCDRERDVFQAFSIFRGGCTLEAARQVTGATLRELRGLVDKSMLQRALNGRYEIHELSREYAAGKLDENLELNEIVQCRHSAYYCNAVREWGNDLKSKRQEIALTEMDLEIENARAAWRWAVEERQVDLLDRSLEGFRYYYEIRRLELDAENAFRFAADHLMFAETEDERRVYAKLLCTEGYFVQGNDQKRALYRQSLSIIEKFKKNNLAIHYEKALVLNHLGQMVTTSDFDEAIRFLESSLELFQELNNSYWIAEVLNGKGRANFFIGDLDEAQRHYEHSLDISQILGDPRKIAQSLNNLDFVARNRGDFEESERLARKILAIYEKIGDQLAIADGVANLGVVLLILGRFQEAHLHLERSSIVHRELDDCEGYLKDVIQLCWTKISLGLYSQAWEQMQTAMDLCQGKVGETDRAYIKGGALSVQGAACLALGNFTEAENLLLESISVYQTTRSTATSVHPYSSLGILTVHLDRLDQARDVLHSALEKGNEIKSTMALLYALTGVALLLAKLGDLERAIEIYGLAIRYPWMANSRDIDDNVGQSLKILTEEMPAETISVAQQRGRERDLEATVRELLAELA